jgi:MinD superfamily P-loop ATPase
MRSIVEQVAGIPLLDRTRCSACGDCIRVCVPCVLALVDERLEIVKPAACDYCGECEAICADGAISCPYDIVAEADGLPSTSGM